MKVANPRDLALSALRDTKMHRRLDQHFFPQDIAPSYVSKLLENKVFTYLSVYLC